MAWTAPCTFRDNSVLTAAQLNTFLRDNMLESMPGRATTAGSVFVGAGRNQIAERVPTAAYISTVSTTTAEGEWQDLAQVGPSVTIRTGAKAFVFISCAISHSVPQGAAMGYAVTGSTEIEPSNERSVMLHSSTALPAGCGVLQSDLVPGINTFTAKYSILVAGTGTFSLRRIAVVPL